MAERYSRIKSRFWTDEKVRNWDDDTRLLALYMLTSPHINMLGCYILPKLYICEDLGWEPERLEKPFRQLLRDGFIKYDEKNRIVLLPNYLKHNPIENENQAKAAARQLAELPKSPLLQDLKQLLEQFNKPFLKPLLEQLDQQIPKPITITIAITESIESTITESIESPDTNVSGAESSSTEPVGSGNSQPPLVEETPTNRKQKAKSYSETERYLVAKLKAWREKMGCPPTQRNWHLRELAVVSKLLKTYTAEEIEACFLAATEEEYWRKRLDSWATVERYLPKWKLGRPRDQPKKRLDEDISWIPFEPSLGRKGDALS